jgi:hypothetical protein
MLNNIVKVLKNDNLLGLNFKYTYIYPHFKR